MKTWFISITLIIFFGVNGLGATSQPAPVEARPAPALPGQAVVQIVRTWEQLEGNTIAIARGKSLGTVIGPHLILTHNHFTATLGTLPGETLSIVDHAGRSYSLHPADVKPIPLDQGTLLLHLPASVKLTATTLADQALIQQLAADDWLTVNYWDDANQRPAANTFKLIRMKDGVMRLADPEHIINSGDSGGGVYFEGRLIGNTWSYNADTASNALGSFNVALVPAQVTAMQHALD